MRGCVAYLMLPAPLGNTLVEPGLASGFSLR
jgi:hypothetical protein